MARTDPAARQDQRDTARAQRWAVRRGLRELVSSRRVRLCGLPGTRADGSVVLRVTDATGTPAESSTGATGRLAGFGGLWSCGSVWMCPECSVRIAAARSEEVGRVLAHHMGTGASPMLVTLTMRHHAHHSLRECLRAAGKAWSAVTSGRAAQRDYGHGLRGWVRSLEVTRSADHGWHVHLHALVVVEDSASADARAALTAGWFARWSAALVRAGMPAPTEAHGLDVQELPVTGATQTPAAWARYVCKGLATEAVMGSTKQAKGTSRSIAELMAEATVGRRLEDPDTGRIVRAVDLHARDLLVEWEAAITGRRQLTWSQRAHDLRTGVADVDPDRSDEEIAAEDLQGEDVAVIPPESWRAVEPRAVELLAVTEREGAVGAYRWLDDLGVLWWRATGLSDDRRHGEAPGYDPRHHR